MMNKLTIAKRAVMLGSCLLLFICLRVSAAAQQQISLTMRNATLEQVFSAIRQQTGFYFLYSNDVVKKAGKVNIDVKDAGIDKVLKLCLAGRQLTYKIIDQTITIQEKAAEPPVIKPTAADTVITGKVTDEKNNPLPGVTIGVEGSSHGAISGADGSFSLRLPAGAKALVFSFMGFTQQRIELTGATTLQVKMAESTKALSEVVVTALGIKRDKKALGYTVAELKGAELSQGKEVNVANALSGKVAGVQVTRAASGAGGSSKIVIRGNNSLQGNSQPLYVVDGIPLDNQNLRPASATGGIDYGDGISNINPEDIESISLLKGPNANLRIARSGRCRGPYTVKNLSDSTLMPNR